MTIKSQEIEQVLKIVVKAVQKGVGADIRDYLVSYAKDTNNAVRFMRADNINTNIRECLSLDTIEQKHFNRFGWTGSLLIDREHKITYTICSKETLEAIPKKKNRRIPHYLQTILHIQNADIEPVCKQMSFDNFDVEQLALFSDTEYRKDYSSIMDADLSFDDGYTHLVIVYEAEHLTVSSICVKLLTPNFQTAQELSLEKYLQPDFSDLTIDDEPEEQVFQPLVTVKKGLREVRNGAIQIEPKIIVKNTEAEKQA